MRERYHLQRIAEGPDGTLGTLLGLATLEEEDRGNAAGESRIPAGTYLCKRSTFNRGGYGTWEVTGVPGRSRILFHIGNTEEDTEGCILLGLRHDVLVVTDEETRERRSKTAVVSSRLAFERFMDRTRELSEWELVIADVGAVPEELPEAPVEIAASLFPTKPLHPERVEMTTTSRAPFVVEYSRAAARGDYVEALYDELVKYYGRIADLRTASLRDMWRLAMDLVLSIQEWSDAVAHISGPARMEIAVEVVWRFVERYGGVSAIRDLVARALDQVLPYSLAATIARLVVRERVARGIVRLVLEFAVREMKERT